MRKNLFLMILFLCMVYSYGVVNAEISLTPIIIDYRGAEANSEIIIVYGNDGNYTISNNYQEWTNKKINNFGNIIKIFIEDERFVAFSEDGKIAISNDKATNWQVIENKITLINSENWINYFIKVNNFYYFRSNEFLYKMDSEFNIIQKTICKFNDTFFYFFYNEKDVVKPLAFYNNLIYTFNDLNVIYTFDLNLKVVDTILISDKINCDKCFGMYQFVNNKNNNYVKVGQKIYNINYNNEFEYIADFNYAWTGFLYDNILYSSMRAGQAGEIYKLNSENYFETIGKYYDDYLIKGHNLYIDYIIYDNKVIFYGEKSCLLIYDINTNIFKLISLSSNRNKDNLELTKHNFNGKIITYKSNGNNYEIDLNSLAFNNINFEPMINYNENNFKLIENSMFQTIYINNNEIIIGSCKDNRESYIFKSVDYGKNFETLGHNQIKLNYTEHAKMFKLNNKFITYQSINYLGSISSSITFSNLTFTNNLSLNFEKEKFLFVDVTDSLNFDILSINKSVNKIFYKSTTDKGETWEVYKEYPTSVYLLESKELELNGKKIWAYTYFDFATDKFHLDVIDVDERKVYNVFEKELTQDEIDTWDYIGFDAAKEKFYLSFYNTLMVSSNIFDENIKWETFNYPNNGKVNKKFQVFDKTIFARYEDEKNEDNVYWINGIEMVGDPTSIENTENQIEEVNYLYTMPPYPNPTVSEVTAKFYWDSRIDIDNSEIAVFDITGNKVSGKENLSLEKLNEWSGNIKWNCIGQPKGTYLIKIQHGNNTKTVKVVVN